MTNAKETTRALKQLAAEKKQRERVILIIDTALAALDMDCRMLSQMTDIGYQTLCRRRRGECDFSLAEISRIANALNMDAQTRAAICGSREKCRYEPGYKI